MILKTFADKKISHIEVQPIMKKLCSQMNSDISATYFFRDFSFIFTVTKVQLV